METRNVFSMSKVWMVLLCSSLLSLYAFPQSTDTLSRTSAGALQFQLVGGVGVYYIGNIGASSFVRLGIDGSLSFQDNSADGTGYSGYVTNTDTAVYTSTDRQPEQKTTSYTVALSGVYALKVVEDGPIMLYCGLGSMVSYSFEKYATSASSVRPDAGGTYSITQDYTRTSRRGVSGLWRSPVRERILLIV